MGALEETARPGFTGAGAWRPEDGRCDKPAGGRLAPKKHRQRFAHCSPGNAGMRCKCRRRKLKKEAAFFAGLFAFDAGLAAAPRAALLLYAQQVIDLCRTPSVCSAELICQIYNFSFFAFLGRSPAIGHIWFKMQSFSTSFYRKMFRGILHAAAMGQ